MGNIIFHIIALFALKYLFAVMTIIESNCHLSRPPPQSLNLSEETSRPSRNTQVTKLPPK